MKTQTQQNTRKLSAEYHALADRIRASEPGNLPARQKQIDRHYNAGTITAHEFRTLDQMIMGRIATEEAKV